MVACESVESSLDAEIPAPVAPTRRRRRLSGWLSHVALVSAHATASASDWVFGVVALTIGLSILSATPIAQFLAFGYLLEASGRVARTGRLRDGLVGVRKASQVGSMVIGFWLFWLPLQLASSLAISAQLVDPDGFAARGWKAGLIILTAAVVIHLLAAAARGGRIRHFLIPFGNPFWIIRRLRQGGAYSSARDAVWQFVAGLRLPYYFRLGFLGFLGTMFWLAIPITLMAASRRAPVLMIPGVILLGIVVLPLPFLQARFAAEGRFCVMFALREERERFKLAPWAFALALIFTLLGAIPLYLLKIEMIPRETIWLPSLVFLVFMYPARVLAGWAYSRSLRREHPRHGFFRWTGRLLIWPVLAFYLLVVCLSQYTAWRGVWSFYEQHAFLLPVPFLGM